MQEQSHNFLMSSSAKEYGVQDPSMIQKFKKFHRGLCLASFFLCLLCFVLHIVAFVSSEWIVSDGESPFQKYVLCLLGGLLSEWLVSGERVIWW